MVLIIANLSVFFLGILMGLLVPDLKGMTKQERRQGAGIGVLLLLIIIVSGIAH